MAINEFILECIINARENGETFKGWTFEEVAADIVDKTDTEHSVKDIAAELVALAAHGEINFV